MMRGQPRAGGRGDAGDGATVAVFVYGTLLAGAANHALLAAARFLGAAETTPDFDLVDCGAFPAMLPGGATAVAGEVYAVDGGTLAQLDELEEHPHLFERLAITLRDGRSVEAYVMPRERGSSHRRIACGSWRRRPS